MKTPFHRFHSALLVVAFLFTALPHHGIALEASSVEKPVAEIRNYHSPYALHFSSTVSELIGDILDGERGNPKVQSSFVFDRWNSKDVLTKYGSWGPPARHFAIPDGVGSKSADWKRERVIATALRYQGISYQHHHIPAWDPPADWPWKKVGLGHNAPGVDCSNFTSFVYNIALGIKINSDVTKQSELTEMTFADGHKAPIQRIEKPSTYAEFVSVLKPGDLIFVRNNQEEISHVIMWVGAALAAPATTPLIIDSTGAGHTDSSGVAIPDGVQLRPFEARSWYYKSAAHVFRLIDDAK